MEFQNPPERKRRRSEHWTNVVKTLRENPNEWANVGNYSPGVATHIKNGKYVAFLESADGIEPLVWMKQHWEIRTSKTDNARRADIFIRWIP